MTQAYIAPDGVSFRLAGDIDTIEEAAAAQEDARRTAEQRETRPCRFSPECISDPSDRAGAS